MASRSIRQVERPRESGVLAGEVDGDLSMSCVRQSHRRTLRSDSCNEHSLDQHRHHRRNRQRRRLAQAQEPGVLRSNGLTLLLLGRAIHHMLRSYKAPAMGYRDRGWVCSRDTWEPVRPPPRSSSACSPPLFRPAAGSRRQAKPHTGRGAQAVAFPADRSIYDPDRPPSRRATRRGGWRRSHRLDSAAKQAPELALMIWLCVFPTLTAINLAFGEWLLTMPSILLDLRAGDDRGADRDVRVDAPPAPVPRTTDPLGALRLTRGTPTEQEPGSGPSLPASLRGRARLARVLAHIPSSGMVEPNSTCFLNRVRKFDSCRGTLSSIGLVR